MAKTFTLIELMIVIALIAILAAISIPGLLQARKSANEASAIATLRTVNSSQAVYKDRNEDSVYGSLTDLEGVGLLDDVVSSGSKSGFRFSLTPDTTNPEYLYTCTANPAVPNQTGDRYFFTDQSGVIRFSRSPGANATSSPIGGQ